MTAMEHKADCIGDCKHVHGMHTAPKDVEMQSISDFFKILGDVTRMRIMWALDQQEMCVQDLAEELGMSKSAISHQLNTLRGAKLVKFRKEGKNVFYSMDDQHVTDIVELAWTHLKHH